MRTKKETLKSVKAEFEKFKEDARNALGSYRFPSTRALLTVEAADAQGRLNGMTVVELITVVQLTKNTGERVYITAQGKTITLFAEKPAVTPMEML
ncbi:MAG: hypothetical protein ABSE80_13130 [Halobacteriota archaeon]|jgi:hypothetical protein